MRLRPYQKELADNSAGSDNVLIQADTGSGKTPVLASIAKRNKYVICVAHRNILVKQLSRTLSNFNIAHHVLATKHTQRKCVMEARRLDKEALLRSRSSKNVVSIDSLLSRHRRELLSLDVSLPWVIIVDEAHHMVDKNKWGKLTKIFPNARIIGATATPCRLDQISLSSKKGGVFHRLLQAESLKKDSVKTLIEMGYLADFKCYSVPELINEGALKLGAHDYTYKSIEAETHKVVFEMAGDAVKHYKRLADGKQALAFCVSIQIAQKTAETFKQAGIASAAIHSKQSAVESARIFDLFEKRVIQVLFNVDMIGEGVDIPAIEALIMLRKTASFGLFRQWCGRSLRPEDNKPHAILIDHAGNIRNHGLPDLHIDWDLENPPQAEKRNLYPCPNCFFLVDAWAVECPECGESLTKAVDAHTQTDVKYIDYALLEIKRKAIDEQVKIAAQQRQLREQLILSDRAQHSDGLSRTVHMLKLWFAECLKNEATIYELNTLFLVETDNLFWVENFTFADVNKNNAKCLKVYKKWLKSQQIKRTNCYEK